MMRSLPEQISGLARIQRVRRVLQAWRVCRVCRVWHAATLGAVVTLGAAPAAIAADKEMSEAEKKAEAAIRSTLNGSAKAIDGCIGRYLKEQPKADGDAKVTVVVQKSGQTKSAAVQTKLPQARTLRRCLEVVAEGWTFPKPRESTTLGVTIPVVEGAKFRVPAPGEKPPEKAEKEEPRGFIRLQPGSFLPGFGPKQDDN